MKKIIFLPLFLLIFSGVLSYISSPNIVSAAEIINDTEVFLFAEKTYDENLYVGAGKTIIESNVSEDLVVLGGEVIVNGNVAGDVFLVGGSVYFKGEVAGDLRILGGEVKIDGVVNGDVLAVGGDVIISESAIINSEIFAVGGQVTVENNSNTELKIIAGNVKLSGDISGPIEITTQNLILDSSSSIGGDLSYYAPQEFFAEDGAVVIGNVSFNEISTIRDTGFVKKAILSFMSFWYLLKFITTLILAFILVYILRVSTQEVSNLALYSFWKSFFAGLLALIFAPVIIAILIMSLVALPIGLLLIILLTCISIISPAVSAIYLGTWAKEHLSRNNREEGVHYATVDLKGATIGVIILTLLQFIPIIGDIFKLVLFVVAMGAIFRYIRLSIIK